MQEEISAPGGTMRKLLRFLCRYAILCIPTNRVESGALSACGTGSCPQDKRGFCASAMPLLHPAVAAPFLCRKRQVSVCQSFSQKGVVAYERFFPDKFGIRLFRCVLARSCPVFQKQTCRSRSWRPHRTVLCTVCLQHLDPHLRHRTKNLFCLSLRSSHRHGFRPCCRNSRRAYY